MSVAEDKEQEEFNRIMDGFEQDMRKRYPRKFREARRAAKLAEQNGHIAQQANTAIALAERYRLPFSSESVIGKVMDGFIVWLQEQQQ